MESLILQVKSRITKINMVSLSDLFCTDHVLSKDLVVAELKWILIKRSIGKDAATAVSCFSNVHIN